MPTTVTDEMVEAACAEQMGHAWATFDDGLRVVLRQTMRPVLQAAAKAEPAPAALDRKRVICALAWVDGIPADWDYEPWRQQAEETYGERADAVLALTPSLAVSGADIKSGMTILLTPGGKPFRVDGVDPFNKSESTFTLTSGAPHSQASAVVSADRWYCLLGRVA